LKPQIFAHRGYSGVEMENSLTAFALALEAGVDGVELDVHLTLDGQLVVIHDEKLDRTTTGKGWIGEQTYEEISKYSLRTLPHETIPTLAHVLELFLDTSIVINIELKNQYIRYPRLVEKAIHEVERYGLAKRVIVSSFYHPCLLEVQHFRPAWSIALLVDCVMYKPWKYAQYMGIDQLHPHHSSIDEEMMRGCKRHGMTIRTYTVNEEIEMRRLIQLGVDAIITNYPPRLRQVIDQMNDSVVE
jgi:glycerophosphoryl diester phosphodiesterase